MYTIVRTKIFVVFVLLCGGTKRQQQRDIHKAWEIARLQKEE